MKNEINTLNEKIDKLRVDLAATNQALVAISSVLSKDQHQQALAALAKLSAAKQRSFERAAMPVVQSLIPLHQEAEDRLYLAIQASQNL